MPTRTDYDERRSSYAESYEELKQLALSHTSPSNPSSIDKPSYADGYDPPGAQIPDEELTLPVIPQQANEFRCGKCFLVRHNHQRHQPNSDLCKDCA